jgi:predicted PurR-regulated permease PerM
LLILVWCGMIIFPFVTPILWGIILAVTLYPLYHWLLKLLKGKKGLTSTIITLLLLAVLLVPSILLISKIVGEVKDLKTAITGHTLVVPPPNAKVAEWPLIGPRIYEGWQLLSTNLESAVKTYHAQITKLGENLLSSMKGVVSNMLMFTISIIIAGVLLSGSEKHGQSTLAFATRLVGDKGQEFNNVVIQTIRNVAKGIIGVAFIQFLLMGIVFVLAGIPFAGIWALLIFLLALVQLPGALVAIPMVIYLYSVREPLPATLWSIAILLFGLSDNVLKPLLMGKGAPVPMLVIFLGAIGGFVLSGFVGMFTGAIVLSLGYKLAGMWMKQNSNNIQTESAEDIKPL